MTLDNFGPREEPQRVTISPQLIFGGVALVVVVVLLGIADFATEWMWYDSIRVSSVFFTTVATRVGLFAVGLLIFIGFFTLNAAAAQHFINRYQEPPRRLTPTSPWEDLLSQIGEQIGIRGEYSRIIRAGVVIGGLFFGLMMGLLASGNWLVFLQVLNFSAFGSSEPAFGKDVSFYVFQMPALRAAEGWIATSLIVTILSVLSIYALLFTYELTVNWTQVSSWLPRAVKNHLLGLAVCVFLLVAVNHVLDLFDLVRSSRGAAYGASFTDLQVQRWADYILALTALGAAGLCVLNMFLSGFRPIIIGTAVWAGSLVVVGGVFPALVQNLDVKPNELDRERPYIAYNIEFTRQSFGLDRIEERDFPAEDAVSPSALQTEEATLENIRLWDHRPLLQTYNQIQAIRQYYQFIDVDVDRYTLAGRLRQVMISARELDPNRLPAEARSWVARQLQYTHGYGVAMSLVNVINQEGLPDLTIRDVPPVGPIPIAHPQIYFGESTNHYVITHTSTPEFDFPQGDSGAFTTYDGDVGIPIGSFLNRVLFAVKFQDPNMLLNTALQSDSRLLFRRNISDRAKEIAPFLRLDSDPYLVIADEGLYWIQDAYTTSDRYPYAQPYRPADRGRPFNYIRNSVKIVTNAKDGSIRFYVTDPSDPIIQTYERIFPQLFTPQEQATPAIRSHFRYPEHLFRVQADVYRLYHMTDPRVFYLREDVWELPNEIFYDQRQPMDPYYVIMRLPGEANPEFILMLPFVPSTRDNMIGWLTARSDAPNYGRMLVYKYPKDKLIFGPMQLETRIDQDPTISSQFSLWNQAGSRIIRGNLLVIPIGNSNLYVEPIYLQATDSPLPELKRVIAATGSKIVMEATLEDSLAKLFGQPTGQPPLSVPGQTPPPSGQPSPINQTLPQLAAEAQQRFSRAQDALRAGDFAGYGVEIRGLQDTINRLGQLSPVP
ncbi:MAG: UPF0182 family protein [Chloroflexi bacterium]|nr:UPF0182 family protein [Chloroflexota bacterium]